MFDIGLPELVMILVIALLVFGPGKMAEIGRDLGKAMRDFRRATTDVQKEFNDALRLDEVEKNPAAEWKPSPPSPTAVIPPAEETATPAPLERPVQEIAAEVAGAAAGVQAAPMADSAAAAASIQTAPEADVAEAAASVPTVPVAGTVAAGGAALRPHAEAESTPSETAEQAQTQQAPPEATA